MFSSPKQLIDHASDLIEHAQRIVENFVKNQKISRQVYRDALTGEYVHCGKVIGPEFPPKAENLLKDAAGNLRDALDHAVYSAALSIQGGVPINTGFPFSRDSEAVKKALLGKKLSGNPPEIRQLLESFQPYQGGNEVLWSLYQIRNASTHRFVVPVGVAAISGDLGISHGVITSGSFGYSRWHPEKQEVEYLRIGPGSTINYQVQISMQVVFEQPESIAGKPVIPTLLLMAQEVKRVVESIECETQLIVSSR